MRTHVSCQMERVKKSREPPAKTLSPPSNYAVARDEQTMYVLSAPPPFPPPQVINSSKVTMVFIQV